MKLPVSYVEEYPKGVFRWAITINSPTMVNVPDLMFTVVYRDGKKYVGEGRVKRIPMIDDILEFNSRLREWRIVRII